LREEKRTIIVVVVVVVVYVIIVVDAEVDARTAFQRSEESRCHVGTDPVGHSVQFVARHEPTVVVVIVVAAVNVVHSGSLFLITLFLQKERKREREMQIVRTVSYRVLQTFFFFLTFLTFLCQFINSISVSYVFPIPDLKFSVHTSSVYGFPEDSL